MVTLESLYTFDVVATRVCSSLGFVMSGTLQIGSTSSRLRSSVSIISTTSC